MIWVNGLISVSPFRRGGNNMETGSKVDFNWIVEEYTKTSDTLEMKIIKDGKNYSENVDGKLIIHI